MIKKYKFQNNKGFRYYDSFKKLLNVEEKYTKKRIKNYRHCQ